MLYYPCVIDLNAGRISRIVGGKMTKDKAVEHLKAFHYGSWRVGEALAQPINHPYFKGIK